MEPKNVANAQSEIIEKYNVFQIHALMMVMVDRLLHGNMISLKN